MKLIKLLKELKYKEPFGKMSPSDDDYAINHGMEHVEEAQVDSPGDVLKKAQLAKSRADASRLVSQQRTLAQSKKNIKDTPTKRRLSKQIADLGVKKADIGVKTAEMSQQLKKKPKMETKINEAHLDLDPDVIDQILILAKNSRKHYNTRDAKGAIQYAIQEYIAGEIAGLKEDLSRAKSELVNELQKYWTREGK